MIRCMLMLSLAICLLGCTSTNKRMSEDLPKQSTRAKVIKQDNVQIDDKGGITLNGRKMDIKALPEQLKTSKVVIEADSSTPYKHVISVMNKIKDSGIKYVSLVTRSK